MQPMAEELLQDCYCKHLKLDERERFFKVVEKADREILTLCMALADTGCCISETLALTADRTDLVGGTIAFESLK